MGKIQTKLSITSLTKFFEKNFKISFCNKVALIIFALMLRRINWDAMGIGTSLACAIHCALLPLFLTSLPVLGIELIDNMTFEYTMIFIALGIGSIALLHGFKRHHHNLLPLM